jgi:hypothetical protein
VDRTGTAHTSDEVSPEYVNNVIARLVEYAPGFWVGALWGACVDGAAAIVLGTTTAVTPSPSPPALPELKPGCMASRAGG